MRTFKELLPLPSDAVKAMIDGLREADKMEGFKITMTTFGGVYNNYCVGCAATATIMKACNVKFDATNIFETIDRCDVAQMEYKDFDLFEMVINDLRVGNLHSLNRYYNTELPLPVIKLEEMTTFDWQIILPSYEAYYEQLKAAGL